MTIESNQTQTEWRRVIVILDFLLGIACLAFMTRRFVVRADV